MQLMVLKMRMRMMIKQDMDTDGNNEVDIDIDTGNGDAINDIKDEDDTDNAIKTHNAIWRNRDVTLREIK